MEKRFEAAATAAIPRGRWSGLTAVACAAIVGAATVGLGVSPVSAAQEPSQSAGEQAAASQDQRPRQEPAASQEQVPSGQEQASASRDPVGRGRYLARHVAMCVQCHSPRTAGGQLVRRNLFHGGRIPLDPPELQVEWALKAPRLAGLPGWSDEQFIRLLTQGRREDGRSPRPPMPPFRMSREDAAAIAAYLRTLE